MSCKLYYRFVGTLPISYVGVNSAVGGLVEYVSGNDERSNAVPICKATSTQVEVTYLSGTNITGYDGKKVSFIVKGRWK